MSNEGDDVKRIYVPASGPGSWKQLLADPDKHWKMGYSARTLAHCWHDSDGWPDEINALFLQANLPEFGQVTPLLVIPELVTSLQGQGGHPHSDVFVLAKSDQGSLISITVEGKAEEPFGNQVLGEWKRSGNQKNRRIRLDFLLRKLGLTTDLHDAVPYQLIQRTACAVVEAERYNAPYAVMAVHSFSRTDTNYEAFCGFVNEFGKGVEPGTLVEIALVDGIRVFVGWARGHERYLTV